jgi:hypothetical protein
VRCGQRQHRDKVVDGPSLDLTSLELTPPPSSCLSYAMCLYGRVVWNGACVCRTTTRGWSVGMAQAMAMAL